VKKRFNVYGVIAMVLVVLFVMAGCKKDADEDDDPLSYISYSGLEVNKAQPFPAGKATATLTYADALDLLENIDLSTIADADGSVLLDLFLDKDNATPQDLIDASKLIKETPSATITINDSEKFRDLLNLTGFTTAAAAKVEGKHTQKATSNIFLNNWLEYGPQDQNYDIDKFAVNDYINTSGSYSRTFTISDGWISNGDYRISGIIKVQASGLKNQYKLLEKKDTDTVGVWSSEDSGNTKVSAVIAIYKDTDAYGAVIRFQAAADGNGKVARNVKNKFAYSSSDIQVYANKDSSTAAFTLKDQDLTEEIGDITKLGLF